MRVARDLEDTLVVKVRPGLKEELRKLGVPQERDLSAEVRLALENWVKPEAVKDRNGGA